MPKTALRNIVLSAKRKSWRMMDPHADEHDKRFLSVREQILQRDDYSCAFCGFRAVRYQHIHHLDDDHANNKPGNLVTACPLCHQCFHLGMAGVRKSGVMVWLPEIPQAELNNLARAVFVAVNNAGVNEQAARSLYSSIESRASVVEQELGPGASNPASFGQAFLTMTDEQYANRGKRMKHIRLLPRMQAFGTEVSFWQSDASAFGTLIDADWSKVAPDIEPPAPSKTQAHDPLLANLVNNASEDAEDDDFDPDSDDDDASDRALY